jgi:hypothetical protein
VAVVYMPKKKPRRAVPTHDNCDALQFLHEILNLRKRWSKVFDDFLPAQVELADLARVSNDELFRTGIMSAVLSAIAEAPTLSRPVYRGQFIERLEEVEQAARLLQQQLETILNPEDQVTLLAQKSLCDILNTLKKRDESDESPLTSFLYHASFLMSAIKIAKHFAPSWVSAKNGRPRGAGGSGVAMNRFIRRLEFAARAAGGKWTLNKNEERGTLIDALEALREYLPGDFLPTSDKHPYSSYERILSSARSDWNNSQFQSQMLELIAPRATEMDQK